MKDAIAVLVRQACPQRNRRAHHERRFHTPLVLSCVEGSGSSSKSLRLLSAQIKLVAPSVVKRIHLQTPPGKTLS
jgi:hypothetical protein